MSNWPAANTTPTPPPRPTLPPQAVIGFGLVFGVGMVVLALLWALLAGESVRGVWYPRGEWAHEVLLGLGIGVGGAVVARTLALGIPALRALDHMLVRALDMRKLRYHHAVLIGLVAGIPEEILFRGAIQPTTGLLLCALIFGALHWVSRVYFLYATVAGLALGLLATWRGDLWAASAAHVTVDAVLLVLMLRAWRNANPSNGCAK